MWTQDLLRDAVWSAVNSSVAAGTTAVNSSIVDNQDYDGCMFIAIMNGILTTSVVTLQIQENSANSTSGMTNAGTAATYTNSSGSTVPASGASIMGVQVYRPLLRYLRGLDAGHGQRGAQRDHRSPVARTR